MSYLIITDKNKGACAVNERETLEEAKEIQTKMKSLYNDRAVITEDIGLKSNYAIVNYENETVVWDTDQKKIDEDALEMLLIREHRDRLLTETDWMALPDVTMSDAWKTYRQDLRDIPASNTVYKDVTWPTQPE